MIKSIYFPNQEFTTKEHLFAEMLEKSEDIISLKKTERKSDCFGFNIAELPKSFAEKGMRMEDGFIYPVINTTMFMDSHDDVQMNNSWNKSVNEQQGKIYYVADHELKVSSIIAHPQDVEMMLKNFTWKELGYNYEGSTQALIFKIAKDAIKMPQALDIINNKYPMQNSVREQYIKLRMAVNSTSPDFVKENEVWNEVIGSVANREHAEKMGYFFAIDESKIIKESSMVLFGSNSATPMLQKDIEPTNVTQDKGSRGSTSQSKISIYNFN